MKYVLPLISLFGFASVVLAAEQTTPTPTKALEGKVIVDGSSTVFPVSEAVAEEFTKVNPKVKAAVAMSGTGGGFKKFCKGELDLTGASRPIEESEIEACKSGKIDFIELAIAYDGIALVVPKSNTWLKDLTVEELKKIWDAGSKISNWKDVRPGFPDLKLTLFGPGHDSGTFDYFTKAINGKEKSSRADFTASEDDNVLVKGVSGEKGALGYFGFAYYIENKEKLNVIPIKTGTSAAVTPTHKTIADGTYRPLSRPIFIYASLKALDRPEVLAFTKFYLEKTPTLSEQVGYVSLGSKIMGIVEKRLNSRVTGSIYTLAGKGSNDTLETLLAKGSKKK